MTPVIDARQACARARHATVNADLENMAYDHRGSRSTTSAGNPFPAEARDRCAGSLPTHNKPDRDQDRRSDDEKDDPAAPANRPPCQASELAGNEPREEVRRDLDARALDEERRDQRRRNR